MTTHESHWENKQALVKLCMINGTKQSVSFSGHMPDRLSAVLVRAEPRKGYATERVRSSVALCQRLAPGAWKIWSLK